MLKLTLQSGRFIVCTENHPLLTVLGWRLAGTLQVGDSIAAVRQLPIPAGEALPFGFAALLGYLTGDGSFGKGNPIVTAAEPEVVAHLQQIAEHHGWVLRRDGKYGYHLRKPSRKGWGNGQSAQERLRAYIVPATSRDKRVPPCIFTAGRDDLCAFLAAYFNSDGSVNPYRSGEVLFSSVSEGLLRDVQHLLTRLGVYSALRDYHTQYKDAPYTHWRLHIAGQDLVVLADALPAIGARGRLLQEVAARVRTQRHFAEYEAIPNGWQTLLKHGLGWHRSHTGVRADKHYKHGTARHIVQAIAESEDNDALRQLCQPDIIWDRIVKIEPLGDVPTYDIEVADTHNFLVENTVVHNSEMVTVRYSAYRLEQTPGLRIIVGAYNQILADKFSRKTRRIVESRMPLSRDRTAVQDWETPQGGGLRAVGVGGGITGQGGDLIIIDDPVKSREEAESAAYRDRVYEWYTDDLFTRAEAGAAIILIMTLWHEDDLAGRILASEDGPNWTVVRLPAEAEAADPLGRPEGAPLCPEKFDAVALAERRRVLGDYSYSALYQQRPRPRDGAMFHREWFTFVDAAPVVATRIRWWDNAGTKDGGAYTCGVLMARDPRGVYYVEDVVRGQWEAPEREAVKRQTAELDRVRYGKVTIWNEQEPGSGGKEQAQSTIRHLAGFVAYAEPVTGDKVTRAEPLAVQAQAGNVHLVRDTPDRRWNAGYLDRLCAFPTGKYKDDVDASSGAFNKLAATRPPTRQSNYLTAEDSDG